MKRPFEKSEDDQMTEAESSTTSRTILSKVAGKGRMVSARGQYLEPPDYESKNAKLARSRSLAMLGKSAGHKNGVISTRAVWKGIHRVSDIRPCETGAEHNMRVFNRENTPWVPDKSNFKQRFAPVRDQFVQKY
jgi:hypothetical protein